jgi:hypothetical protein
MKYRTKQPIKCNGKIYKPDTIIELTSKQAKHLNDYVVAIPEKIDEFSEIQKKSNSKTNKGDNT